MDNGNASATSLSKRKLVFFSEQDWLSELDKRGANKRICNRLIMDFLVVEGFQEAASRFSKATGVTSSIDIEKIGKRKQIFQLILDGQIESAVEELNTLDPAILQDEDLYFALMKQQLVEMIRASVDNPDAVDAALTFAQEKLAALGLKQQERLPDLEEAMCLLAFSKPAESLYGKLLSDEQRRVVAEQVNKAVLESQSLKQESLLAYAVQLMRWSEMNLSKSGVKFPKMTDITTGQIEYDDDKSIEDPANK